MSQWVGVHGIGQQRRGRKQILQTWIPALQDGLELATRRRPSVDLDIAYYGRLFRRSDRDPLEKGSRSDDADLLRDLLADLDEDELSDLASAVAEIAPSADLPTGPVEISKALLWVPVTVGTLIGAVEQGFPQSSGVLQLWTLRQVRSYLRDPSLKAEVDQIVAEAAAGATVLIGHSLGSVVAYDFLCRNPGHSVELLLTLGSPLGLSMVRRHLPSRAPGVARWVNVRDPHDPVTAAGVLRRWYPEVEDRQARNGSHAHDAERYLRFKATGEALKDFLPSVVQ